MARLQPQRHGGNDSESYHDWLFAKLWFVDIFPLKEKIIEAKSKYIQEKKLGGMMFWELSEDKKTGGLVDKIYQSLHK